MEFLAEIGPAAERQPLPLSVAYHDACHLGHAQGIRKQPRTVLKGIPGVEIREIKEAEICCGSAGIYNMVEPEPATELGERKARNVLKTGAQMLVTSNPGCILQIQASLKKMGTIFRWPTRWRSSTPPSAASPWRRCSTGCESTALRPGRPRLEPRDGGESPRLPADAVFLDLEDAVAPDEKAEARGKIVQALQELDWEEDRPSTGPTPSTPLTSTGT